MDGATLHQLMRPAALGPPAATPALRETHISWVILSGDFAYKIKKPVDFGFLDFSTLEQRKYFCEQELTLNTRFAPELYLAVVAITADQDGPRVEGTGPVIDYAVKMRRFDERQLLDNIAARGELDRPLVRALARELARQQGLASRCNPAPGSEEPGSPAALLAAITQNFDQVRDYALAAQQERQLATVEQWTLRRHRELSPLLERRAASGRVIDGHGDAHLGNIALIDGAVRLFDCIEFNPALRIMDCAGELALLGMDLQARSHAEACHWLLGDYLEYSGDYEALALLNLYRCYYAMVRAKVALLREPARQSIQASPAYEDFCRYLALAASYCHTPKQWLAITHGVSGSGKSTVADRLVAASGAVRIRSDVERKRLYGLAPEQRSAPADEQQLYSSAMSARTFQRLAQLAQLALEAGFAVIVDATFLRRRSRDPFRQLAQRLAMPFVILHCTAPPGQLRQRLLAREQHGQDASEAGVRVMQSQLQVVQPPAGEELACQLLVNCDEDGATLWRQLRSALGQ